MKCPECQFENPEDAKFCNECGSKLEIICSECGKSNKPGSRFCKECGYDLRKPTEPSPTNYSQPQSYTPKYLADKILTTRSSIEGERKTVTVLFADVANYTSMAEKLDPEEVHQVMDGCFKIMMDEIHKCEGTINQFTGDGVMALFGAPVAHEDHAQMACLAALGIQEALEVYGEDLKRSREIDFKMRIGLNSGPVVVGSIGDDLRMDYTAIGDTTNLAARMEQLARPGTVLLTEDTHRIVLPYFRCQSVGKIKVKGKEEPVEAYKLKGKREVYRPRLGLEREIYSEMVGRDKELDLLELQIMKAVTGEGSIVNIIGEAGIGKSRLVAELKNHDVMNRVTLLEGRAISMGRNLSFHPIIDLLKHWARINESDTEATAFDKLQSTIWNVCPDDTDEVLSFLATLMGMQLYGRYAKRVSGIGGEALEKLLVKNVRELLIRIADRTPLLIVTEDLHWADLSSIELLESLYRLAETQKIVFVNVFRPDHKETGDRIVETIKERHLACYTEILLRPLTEETSEALINNMLNISGLYHTVRQEIVERSGGNPFFIEEVVRSLIDDGAVVKKNGKFEVTEKIHTSVIPQTINDVLMARIDRLEEKTRDLIKFASVIGRNFFHRILTEAAKTIHDIDQRLTFLQERQLIRQTKRREELEYLFSHVLAQETAYESILVEKRKQLHLKVADSIEKVFNEKLHDFYGMLAFHYSRGEDESKAEKYLLKAGEVAAKASASSEALYYYQEALNLYLKKHGDAADPAKVAMLEKNIAQALCNKGRYNEAVEYFDKVLSYHGEKIPRHLVSVMCKFLIGFLHFLVALYFPYLKFKRAPTEKDTEIIELFFWRCEALSQSDPRKWFIESFFCTKRITNLDLSKSENGVGILGGLSVAFTYTGISFSLSRKVLGLLKDKINRSSMKSIGSYEMSELLHYYYTGDWGKVKGYDEELANQILSKGEIFFAVAYIGYHAGIDRDRGFVSEVERLIEKLSQIGEEYDHNFARTLYYMVNGTFLVEHGRFHEALDVINEMASFVKKADMSLYFSIPYVGKTYIHIMTGDIKGAEESLFYAKKYLSQLVVTPEYSNFVLIPQFMLDLYRLEEYKKTGRRPGFSRSRRRAVKSGRKMDNKSKKVARQRTQALRMMGTYFWLIGKEKKALKLWKDSTKEGERLGARLELSRTYMEVAKHLLEPKSKYKELEGIGAEEYLDKARTMFEEMDLQWDIEELERIPGTS